MRRAGGSVRVVGGVGVLTTAVVFVTSVTLLAAPGRRLFGAGMLMAWAANVIVGGGVCVAILIQAF